MQLPAMLELLPPRSQVHSLLSNTINALETKTIDYFKSTIEYSDQW